MLKLEQAFIQDANPEHTPHTKYTYLFFKILFFKDMPMN